MIKILCLILFLINCLFLRIFSEIGRILSSKYCNSNVEKNKQANKHNFLRNIKAYLYGLYCYECKLTSYIPSYIIRNLIFKYLFLLKMGRTTKIRMGVELIYPWNIQIGANTLIGQNCILDGRAGLIIGNNVNISDKAAVWTMQHDINNSDFGCEGKCGKVTIKNRVWLCFRSVILPKITIGEGAVLAANAVATKDCEEYGIYAGIPAKKTGNRTTDLQYELDISRMSFM